MAQMSNRQLWFDLVRPAKITYTPHKCSTSMKNIHVRFQTGIAHCLDFWPVKCEINLPILIDYIFINVLYELACISLCQYEKTYCLLLLL